MLFQKGQQEKRPLLGSTKPRTAREKASLLRHPWGSDPKLLSTRQQPVSFPGKDGPVGDTDLFRGQTQRHTPAQPP